MKITIFVPLSSPSLEPELLLRFVMRQLSETTEPDSTEPPPVLLALTLAVVSNDKKFHDRLKEQVASSSDNAEEILVMSKDLFLPALGQIEYGQTLYDLQRDEANQFPDEQNYKQVLLCALSAGKRILTENDFGFIKVFEFLTRTGLLCCSFRLQQFEEVCESFQDDPENLVRRGIEIIEAVTFSPSNEN